MNAQEALAIAYNSGNYGHRDWLDAYEYLREAQASGLLRTDETTILVHNLEQWRKAQPW